MVEVAALAEVWAARAEAVAAVDGVVAAEEGQREEEQKAGATVGAVAEGVAVGGAAAEVAPVAVWPDAPVVR